MGVAALSEAAINVRLDEHNRRLKAIEDTHPDVMASELRGLHEDMREIREEIRSFRRAAYALATSIAGGAVLIAFTAWQLGGG